MQSILYLYKIIMYSFIVKTEKNDDISGVSDKNSNQEGKNAGNTANHQHDRCIQRKR